MDDFQILAAGAVPLGWQPLLPCNPPEPEDGGVRLVVRDANGLIWPVRDGGYNGWHDLTIDCGEGRTVTTGEEEPGTVSVWVQRGTGCGRRIATVDTESEALAVGLRHWGVA